MNKEYNSNMFFWYFPAKKNSANAPVLLWLQGISKWNVVFFFKEMERMKLHVTFSVSGGPGGSSLYGLFTENGPFSVSSDQKLIPREYSWHLNYNLIYIDNPVGTGFSFTESDNGFATNETQVGQELLIALQQFFVLFPKLQKNDFFVSGESYAGKYIPAIGYAIYQDSKRTTTDPLKPKINLKGLAIGDGFTDPINQLNFGDYLYQLGLIDSNAVKMFEKTQNEGIECLKNRDFMCGFKVFNTLLGDYFYGLTGFRNSYNYLKIDDDDTSAMGIFLQKSQTRRAIHVGNKSYESTNVYQKLLYDFMDSVADWLGELLSHYPVLIFYGQLDVICAYPLAENYLKNLNFSSAEEYKTAERNIWRVDDEVAGYAKQAGNLTEILVRNAGKLICEQIYS